MKARELDELLGITARLAIVLTLVEGETWTFTDLRAETGLADGNLHVQTKKLIAAEYLESQKIQRGNRLVTAFTLTPHGRNQLKAHVQRLGSTFLGGEFPRVASQRKKNNQENDGSQVW